MKRFLLKTDFAHFVIFGIGFLRFRYFTNKVYKPYVIKKNKIADLHAFILL